MGTIYIPIDFYGINSMDYPAVLKLKCCLFRKKHVPFMFLEGEG